MKNIITLSLLAVILSACNGLQNASLNTNHSNTSYSKESGIISNVETNNASINYKHASSASM